MEKTTNNWPIFLNMANKTPKKPEDTSTPLFKVGDLVCITAEGHDWMSRTKKFSGKITLTGRTAIVHDVYDWDSERGQQVLANRENNGKWIGLDSQDFKYVILVLFPEIVHEGKTGVGLPDVLPYYHPRKDGKLPLFLPYPKHLSDLLLGLRKL